RRQHDRIGRAFYQARGGALRQEPFHGGVLLAHSRPLPAISRVAPSNQRAMNAGMDRPSQSTMARCTSTGAMLILIGAWPAGHGPNTIGCRCRNRPAKAITRPTSSGTVSHGQVCMVAVSTRNSLTNTPNGGNPAMASVPTSRLQPTAGWVRIRPRTDVIAWLP